VLGTDMGPAQGPPAFTGPSSQFPTGPLSTVESFGAAQSHDQTVGAIAGAFKAELSQGTLVRGGGSIESHGIGAKADHSA
jgi:hypothetical protein